MIIEYLVYAIILTILSGTLFFGSIYVMITTNDEEEFIHGAISFFMSILAVLGTVIVWALAFGVIE